MRSRPCAGRCASSPARARARRRRSPAGSRTRSRRARSRRRDPRGHVHGQGGERDAGAARRRSASTASRARTFHSAALAQLRAFGRTRSAGSCPSKALALRQIANALPPPYQVPAGRRPRDRDRVGEEPAPDAGHVSRWARRPRAADSGRSDGDACTAQYEQRKERARLRRLRGSARARDSALRRGRPRARGGPRALPRIHRRRVPGREPPAADAARPLARGRATSSAPSATTTSRSTRSQARRRGTCSALPRRFPNATVVRLEDELSLVAAGARAREPDRARARWCREGAARDACRRAGAGAA